MSYSQRMSFQAKTIQIKKFNYLNEAKSKKPKSLDPSGSSFMP